MNPRKKTMVVLAVAAMLCCSAAFVKAGETAAVFTIPVIVVKYFPTNDGKIDIKVTGDCGASLEETRAKTDRCTAEAVHALQEGSRYHAYRNPKAPASVQYTILKTIGFLEPLPTVKRRSADAPMTDYNRIMQRINIQEWVEQHGVKEVWIWGYHGGKVGLWESNMAGPYGDISNSSHDPKDLPVLDRTYTVYHYNYQRGTSEAVEDHMHQFEALFNFVDGRERTPHDQWNQLFFWGKFVGSDISHKIIRPGCGWAHYPPNAEGDYDWANPRYVATDIADWKPDGSGAKTNINCSTWGGTGLGWFVYWMQSLPGKDNGLVYQGRPLTNWWLFVGDFDTAMKNKIGLLAPAPAPAKPAH